MKKLSDVADIIMGQSPPSSSYNTGRRGIPFFQGKAEFGALYPEVKKWCDAPTKIAKKNDILISVRAPVGPTNLCPEKACIGRGLAAVRAKNGSAFNLFILYYLRSIENKLAAQGKGSTFTAINREDLERIKFPDISYQNQETIARLLSKTESAIEKRREAIRLLDDFLKSTFVEMFGDPAAAQKRNSIVCLGDITSLVSSGSTPLGGEATYLKKGIKFIRSQNVHMNRLAFDDIAFISEEVHRQMKRTWVKRDDVLLNITGASIGRVAYFNGADDSANVNQHVCIIRPVKDKVIAEYLSFLISMPNYQKKIFSRNAGATRQAFNFNQIREFEIPLASLNEQQKFARIIEAVGTLKERMKSSEIELQNLFAALMQKALNGDQNQ